MHVISPTDAHNKPGNKTVRFMRRASNASAFSVENNEHGDGNERMLHMTADLVGVDESAKNTVMVAGLARTLSESTTMHMPPERQPKAK